MSSSRKELDQVLLPRDPATAMEAATKQYVDNAIGGCATAAQGTEADNAMPRAGGTFTSTVVFTGAVGETINFQGDGFSVAMVMAGTNKRLWIRASGMLLDAIPSYANANGGFTAQHRIFVQSTDPGAAAADGDLWFW